MATRLWFLLLTGCVLRISSTEPLEITSPPQNAVAEAGRSVDLACGIDQPYDGFFEWRAYTDGSFAGHQVCSVTHSQFTAKYDKYRQFGNFGLTIDHVHWRDGGKYSCAFLSAGDVRAEANVLIIDQLEAWSEPLPVDVGHATNLSCTVTFGGPVVDVDVGMFPQLTMTLGDAEHPLNLSATRRDPGEPGIREHRLTVTAHHVATEDDIRRSLICTVSTTSPAFSKETTIELGVGLSSKLSTLGFAVELALVIIVVLAVAGVFGLLFLCRHKFRRNAYEEIHVTTK